MIYSKSPIDLLWDKLKSLNEKTPIYKNNMLEDENSIPKTYILLISASDLPKSFGDSTCLTRSSDCDISVVSKGSFRSDKNLHNTTLASIEDILKQNKISYKKYSLGYDSNSKNTKTTLSVTLDYYG